MKVFTEYYYPLWVGKGFNWDLFPELTINLNIEDTSGAINTNREHYNTNTKTILSRMITRDDFPLSATEREIKLVMETRVSYLFHEIMHHIHSTYFRKNGKEDMDLWNIAYKLMGRNDVPDFKRNKNNTHYQYTPAYEILAIYFDDVIKGRIINNDFLNFIKEVVGLPKQVVLTNKDYIIKDDRTYIPVRMVSEKLGFDVKWIDKTREVIISK